MLPVVLEAAERLIVEEEVFCEVVALSSLLPLDMDPVLASVERTGACVTAEGARSRWASAPRSPPGCRSAPGAPCADRCGRVAAGDGIIPSAHGLEDGTCPTPTMSSRPSPPPWAPRRPEVRPAPRPARSMDRVIPANLPGR